jgi:hypothetical protein
MSTLTRSSAGLVLALSLTALARPADKELSRVEVARLGKASTALVEASVLRGKAHGSAFCVHPSGLFVTNEHVVRGAASVALVLDPALKTQKVVKARVLRADRERDLALLRAEGAGALPALPLGSAEGLDELMEVIAFGFPFGTALSAERGSYPAVSVNVGSITSLRKRKGALYRIQVDVALNPGNSGGPVLDRKGKVIGKVDREGLYCIPAAHGSYYIGMKINGEGAANKHRAAVYLSTDARPLVALKDVDWPLNMNEWDRERFGNDRRIHFLPEARLLITIPSTNDKLVLHKLDVDAALEKSGIDYLFVTSRPPSAARKGQVFTYQLAVKSKKGGVTCKLDSGSEGMTVSKAGLVRWAVPADFKDREVDVIVTVGDRSEQEVFHTFKLAVVP